MDTREKIVLVEQLAARLDRTNWLAVAGTFDPLTLRHAERLAELSGNEKSVLAVVEPGECCLLPVEARAILVAALKSVQLVVVGEADSLPKSSQIQIAKDESGERERSAAFIEHVKGRQHAR